MFTTFIQFSILNDNESILLSKLLESGYFSMIRINLIMTVKAFCLKTVDKM